MKRVVLITLLFFSTYTSFAQTNEMIAGISSAQAFSPVDTIAKLQLKQVFITGNRKTKDYIILREMRIKPGDSVKIADLNHELEKDRDYIYNTTLFVDVTVEPVIIDAFSFNIRITVKERWYIFPIPEFQLVDRSFNEWLDKYNGSLDRVNYGIKFSDFNASGRKDEIIATLINGYTRNITLAYNNPYANAALTHGNKIAAEYEQTREIPYKTGYGNNYIYYKSSNFENESWSVYGSFSIRKAIKKRQTFNLSYNHIKVADSVIIYNPKYFNSTSPYKDFFDLAYELQYTDVNNVLYPLKGYSAKFIATKRGFGFTGGINMFSLEAYYNRYFSLGKKWYTSFGFIGKIKFPFEQPYINQAAMGIGDIYLRGLELFVIDGVASGIAKFDIKKEILHFNVPTFIKSKTYNKIPFRFYAKTFTDVGYSYLKDPPSLSTNRFLYTGGFGIDIITLYDIHLNIEYSFNQFNQKNLFLHTR